MDADGSKRVDVRELAVFTRLPAAELQVKPAGRYISIPAAYPGILRTAARRHVCSHCGAGLSVGSD